MLKNYSKSVTLPMTPDHLFKWHERVGAFERLSPPWDPVEIIEKDPHIQDGAKVRLKVRVLGLSLPLEVIHEGYREGVQFQDRQVRGPFAFWRHTHAISQADQGATLTDSIEYTLPLGVVGSLFGGRIARARLDQLFHYRHRVMEHDARLHTCTQGQHRVIAVSGSSGVIGVALCALLSTGGHRVIRLVRGEAQNSNERSWPTPDEVPDLSDIDVVIHLAGENVAQRWSERSKKRILESRTLRTRALAKALADHQANDATRDRALICASGIGYYGDQGDEEVDESSPLGEGFLADTCRDWEAACDPARVGGVRVVNMRIGIVLSPSGGALAKLLPPFQFGVGGPIGAGRQWMSWISLHDVVGALYFSAFTPQIEGVVNAVAPNPKQNRDFSKILGRVLRRPALFPVPPMILKLIFGEMAQETILSGQFVKPTALLTHGYPFMHTGLEEALRFELGRVLDL